MAARKPLVNVAGALQELPAGDTIDSTTTGSAAKLTTGRTISITGEATWSSPLFDGSADVTAAITFANTTVAAGSYGSATQVPTYTVDAKGRLTAASNTSIQIAESQVTNLTTDLAAKAPLASPTFTGTVTAPTITTTGATSLTLSNATSNLISFNTNGIGAPTYTTRSAGTKILLYPSISSNLVDGAIGVESGYIWNSVGYSTSGFKWYGGTTVAATLAGTGDLTTTGTVSGSSATGFRNKIINGDFQIWQGGTSFTNPSNNATAYCADQWQFYRLGFAPGITATQQQTQTASKGIRIQRTAGDTSLHQLFLGSVHESIDVVKMAGKKVTLQFKVKCGANFSAADSLMSTVINYGLGTDGTLATGFTSLTSLTSQTNTVSTTLTQLNFTFTLPSNASQFGVWINYTPTGTAGANDWFEITDVQLEEGSVATPFERRPYGLELSLCQRYYEVLGDAADSITVRGYQTAGLNILAKIAYKSTKRTTPTVTKIGTWSVNNCAQPTTLSTGKDFCSVYSPVTATGDAYFTTIDATHFVTVSARL